MNKKTITLTAAIGTFAIIIANFWFWSEHKDDFPKDPGGTLSDGVTAGKEPAAREKDSLSDWKTYTNEEAGFAFKYPVYFKDLNFGKTGLTASEIVSYSSPFFFRIIQKNKQFNYFNQESVDPDWNRDEFVANMGISGDEFKIYFVKRLNPKSVLVAYNRCIEGSGRFSLDVLAPISNDYPNLVISIGLSFSDDPLIKDYENSLKERGLYDECKYEPYGQIAQKIEDGTYSDELNSYIETARQIADSVTLIDGKNDAGITQRIENGEYYSSIDNVKKKVILENGKYYIEPDAAKTSFGIHFSIEKSAVGDLDGDGKNDAAVILNSFNEGGSIPVYDLNILINQGGKLAWRVSKDFPYGTQIKSIDIESGEIVIAAVVPEPGEMPCCPTNEKVCRYRLANDKIVDSFTNMLSYKITKNHD